MNRFTKTLSIVIAISLSAHVVRANSVYQQTALTGADMITQSNFFDASESSTADGKGTTGFYGSTYADNFTLASTATITNVAWTGYIENDIADGNPVDDRNIQGFEIDIFAPSLVDPFNFDNNPIYSQIVSLADANAAVVESPNLNGTTTYNFNAGLTSAQTFQAGQEYFIGINAILKSPGSSSYFWSAAQTNPNDPNPDTIAVDGHVASNGFSYDVEWNGQFADPSINYAGVQGLHDLAFTLSDANTSAPPVAPLPTTVSAGGALLAGLALAMYGRTFKRKPTP